MDDDDDDDDGWPWSHPCIALFFWLYFFPDAPRVGLSGLTLKGFQDTLRRPVALYPDRGKLCTYPD
jgi:hypothetical protein